MAESTRSPKRQRLSKVDTSAAVITTANSRSSEDTVQQSITMKQDKTNGTVEEPAGPEQRRTLFVRSLAPETTTEALAEHFSQSFPIKHAVAVTADGADANGSGGVVDGKVGAKKCKGYGFVTFTDPEDAVRAREELDGSVLLGRKIKVEVAEARKRGEAVGGVQSHPDSGKLERAKNAPGGAAAEAQTARQGPRLIVRNLPWSVGDAEALGKLFMSYGKLKHVSVPKKGGKMIGFGVVVIRGRRNAEKAIEGVNGKVVDGRTLAVDWAVDRETWEAAKGKMEKSQAAEEDEEEEEDDARAEDSLAGDADDATDVSSNDVADSDDGDWSETDIEGSLDANDELDSDLEKVQEQNAKTIFVRNLPFSCADEDLSDHFRQFGPVRYARVVYDRDTEQPRGTGFVCFFSAEVCATCLRTAPKAASQNPKNAEANAAFNNASVLQDENLDTTGKYTMDGRVLQISQAVTKTEATKLTAEGHDRRNARDRDKRRLYLLAEGTIPHNSELYKKLAPSELAMREASMKQRKTLIQGNPSLHLSLTRLSIRNIPRNITSALLKDLAREAVVGFAKDVKAGARQTLSKEEKMRGFEDMKDAEHERKLKQKGIVKQAKVVFEGREGQKVKESEGTGRSRGYGFIEYYTHRNALMALRWLNGHAMVKGASDKTGPKLSADELKDRKRRLIVEFAIENAQVVTRRRDRESKARGRAKDPRDGDAQQTESNPAGKSAAKQNGAKKRKRDATEQKESSDTKDVKDDKLAKRSRIIQKKRMQRRSKKAAA